MGYIENILEKKNGDARGCKIIKCSLTRFIVCFVVLPVCHRFSIVLMRCNESHLQTKSQTIESNWTIQIKKPKKKKKSLKLQLDIKSLHKLGIPFGIAIF